MADNRDISALPSLTFSHPFVRGRYITGEHIKFLENEGFTIKTFSGDAGRNHYYRHLMPNINNRNNDVTIIISSGSISVKWPEKFESKNFKLNFIDFGSFAAAYEEAVRRVYNL